MRKLAVADDYESTMIIVVEWKTENFSRVFAHARNAAMRLTFIYRGKKKKKKKNPEYNVARNVTKRLIEKLFLGLSTGPVP